MQSSFRADVSSAIKPWLDRELSFEEIEPILHALLPCFTEEDAKRLFSEELLSSWGK
jgi:hypothetical protein